MTVVSEPTGSLDQHSLTPPGCCRPTRRWPANRPPRSSRSSATIRWRCWCWASRIARAAMLARRTGDPRAAGRRATQLGHGPARTGHSRSVARGRGDEAIAALAARGGAEARPAAGLARARRPPHGARTSRGADAAYAQHIRYSTRDPQPDGRGHGAVREPHPRAEALLRDASEAASDRRRRDPHAGRSRARASAATGCGEPARALPGARAELPRRAPQLRAGAASQQQARPRRWREIETLLAAEPRQSRLSQPQGRDAGPHRRLRAGDRALRAACSTSIRSSAKVWMSYGHALKTAGRQDERDRRLSAQHRARRRASARPSGASPTSRPFRFDADDVAAMRAQLARARPRRRGPPALRFRARQGAGGRGRLRRSPSQHYAQGNALRRAQRRLRRRRDHARTCGARKALLHARVLRRARRLRAAARPIRSSSSACRARARRCSSRSCPATPRSKARWSCRTSSPWRARCGGARDARARPRRIREVLAALDADELRALGEQYLERTRIQRKTGAPFFIDKMPNNFAHVGLIHLILPNAKIIDARRHPLGCCFSGFKQHFARGQHFTYGLDDLGRYYRDYVELMAHFDAVLPGRVHRVIYERMVDDTEAEVRAPARLLRPAVRGALPALLRERARRAHRQLRAGAPADLPRRRRPLAALRALARPAEGGARAGARALSGSAGVSKPHDADSARRVASTTGESDTMTRSRQAQTRNARRTARLPLAVAIALAVASPRRWPQATPRSRRRSNDAAALGEVIVTAQKRDGEPAGRAAQHPGARHARSSKSCTSRTSTTT